jgi:hypothetical protein
MDLSGKHQNFQITEEFDHTHSFIGMFCYKIFFLEFEQGKQPRSFDIGNAWWTINNHICGIDVNIKSACCSNFTKITEIQPVRGLSINIVKFAFGANSFIGQSRRICDHQTSINPIKKSGVRKLNILDKKVEYFKSDHIKM